MARSTKRVANTTTHSRKSSVFKIPIDKCKDSSWTAPQKIIPYPHLPVLTLQFSKMSHQTQALRRIGAFYEHKDFRGVYIPLFDPRCRDLCENYEGFNFPLINVQNWFRALCKHLLSNSHNRIAWWDECSEGELWLLNTLQDRGWLDLAKSVRVMLAGQAAATFQKLQLEALNSSAEAGETPERGNSRLQTPPESPTLAVARPSRSCEGSTLHKTPPIQTPYIISQLANLSDVATHELQHVYYHLFPAVRHFVQGLFNSPALSSKERNTILFVLERRNYAEEVYVDEFQAYAVGMYKGDGAEFGNNVVDEKAWRLGEVIYEFCQMELAKSMP